jgi:hypothetical protein
MSIQKNLPTVKVSVHFKSKLIQASPQGPAAQIARVNSFQAERLFRSLVETDRMAFCFQCNRPLRK